jgi:hypothetical protein
MIPMPDEPCVCVRGVHVARLACAASSAAVIYLSISSLLHIPADSPFYPVVSFFTWFM